MEHSYDPLSARIARSDPRDGATQGDLAGRLRALMESLERASAYDLAGQLDLPLALAGYLVRGEDVGPVSILRLVSDAVARVEDGLSARTGGASRWVGDDAPEAVAGLRGAPPLPLRLESERLFGEVLLQLGFVDGETLARGLQLQRASGQRLGETLVSMGALSWSQVERASAVQERLRRACAT